MKIERVSKSYGECSVQLKSIEQLEFNGLAKHHDALKFIFRTDKRIFGMRKATLLTGTILNASSQLFGTLVAFGVKDKEMEKGVDLYSLIGKKAVAYIEWHNIHRGGYNKITRIRPFRRNERV